ncbi:MAG: MATE family efflux transporter [Lachnospiraceae bacterium]|nr:MATE family efflux transporter [Lachnospiraceae bacterium]
MARFKEKVVSLIGAQDMTVGNPTSVMLKFAVPLLIGNFAQQLYNTVDAIIVGKHIGDGALGAVGASNPILNLILSLFMGVATGAGIVVAQYFGAKDRKRLSKSVGNILLMTLVVGIVTTIFGIVITTPVLKLTQTPDDIFADARSYLLIIMAGFIGTAFYNMGAGILRGLGDSIMPLVFLLVACGINIVLDLLFVAAFKWGVAGVAYATIIAQFISAILTVWRIFSMKAQLDFDKEAFTPDYPLCFRIVRIGLPAGLTQAIFASAQVFVQSLTNSFGTAFIATTTAVMRVDGFAMMPNFTFGMAMTTYVGQNVGAKNKERVDKAAFHGLRMGLITSAVLIAAILIFSEGLLSIFTETEEVIDMGARMIRLLAFGYFAFCVTQTLGGIMRGAGDTMTPMVISLITTIIVRLPSAYGIAYLTRSPELPNGMPESIYYSLLIAWVIGAVATIIAYLTGVWKRKIVWDAK